MAETKLKMIINQDHKALIPPNDNEIIWRYLNLKKFDSLLKRKSLFFCRPDRFSDPFEGSITKGVADDRINVQKEIQSLYGEKSFNKTIGEKNINELKEIHKHLRMVILINCWHINNHESDGMWQLYLKSNEGVCIKSSVLNVLKSFEKTPEGIMISKVRYIDYDKDIFYHPTEYTRESYNFYTSLVHKRIEFKDESELRLLYHNIDMDMEIKRNSKFWSNQEFEKGMMISVDLDILIDEIIIPPTADEYIEDKIKAMLETYKLDKPVRKSKLSKEPIY